MLNLFWTEEKQEDNYDFKIKENKSDNKNDKEEIWQVALDILENQNEFIIVAPLAGLELDKIDLSLDWNVLTIFWEREKPLELYTNWIIYRVSEAYWWKFSRNIILPDNLDFDNIKAVLEKNILIVRIAKLRFNSQSIKIDKIGD